MKTAARVFIIISCVLGFFLIFPLVIGIIALRRIDNPVSKEDTITIAILTMIFCSLPGGIFMLLGDDDVRNDFDQAFTSDTSKEKGTDLDELKKAKDLYDSGAISESEYEDLKKKLLNK